MTTDVEIKYAQLSSLSFSEFTPSRVTRISSNPYLQEHLVPGPLFASINSPKLFPPLQLLLKGKYAQLDFSDSKTAPEQDYYSTLRRSFSDDQLDYCTIKRPANQDYSTVGLHISEEHYYTVNSEQQEEYYTNYYTSTSEEDYYSTLRPTTSTSPVVVDIPLEPFRPRLKALNSSSIHSMERPTSFSLAITEDPILLDPTSGSNSPSSPSPFPPTLPPKPKFPSRKSSDPEHYAISLLGSDLSTSALSTNQWILAQTPSPLLLGEQPSLFFESHPTRLCSIKKSAPSESNQSNSAAAATKLDDGEEIGNFFVSYIGTCDIDKYLDCIDECVQTIINPSLSSRSTEASLYIYSERIKLEMSKPDALSQSLEVSDIVLVGQCSKNKHLIGIVLWKPSTALKCHFVRCSDPCLSNTVLHSIQYVVQCYQEEGLKKNDNQHHMRTLPANLSSDNQINFKAVYIGCIKASKHQSVNEISHKVLLEQKPSSSKEVEMLLSLSQVKLIEKKVCIQLHKTSTIQAIGVYQNDRRYIGYVTNDEAQGLIGHVVWCSTVDDVIYLVSYFRQACQFSYQKLKDELEDSDGSSHGLISRLRSFTMSRSPSPSHKSPSHSKPPLSQRKSASPSSSNPLPYMDVPSKRKDSVHAPTETTEEEQFSKFFVTYMGTANLLVPFTSLSIVHALDAFDERGVAAGMATSLKNSIQMHISPMGINLSDKKHKMFVSRNYPRNQILGFCRHPFNPAYLAFATLRPGFSEQLRVHVFYEGTEQMVHQIIDSMKLRLKMNPLI